MSEFKETWEVKVVQLHEYTPKTVIEPTKAQFLPLFNVNLRKPNFFLYSMSTYLNPISTQPQLNFN